MTTLPNLGCKTNIKTAPKDLSSLFDFAFVGPFMGIFASLVFLVLGAKLTAQADPTTLQLYPSLPIATLRFSTLGNAILDTLLGGALQTAPASSGCVLHPYAVAGYFGLLINGLDLLPLGSTDGGRISQALFQRRMQDNISGGIWFGLLAISFFPGADVLTTAWIVSNIANGDKPEPCENEVDGVNIFRTIAAFALWFVAYLAIVPVRN